MRALRVYTLLLLTHPSGLICLNSVVRTEEMRGALQNYIEEVIDRPYEQKFTELLAANFGKNKTEDLSSLFCSELVAAALKR